jgi:hypothetical protein
MRASDADYDSTCRRGGLPEYRPAGAGLVPEEAPANDAIVYETVTCIVCQRVHLVNPATGNVLTGDDD